MNATDTKFRSRSAARENPIAARRRAALVIAAAATAAVAIPAAASASTGSSRWSGTCTSTTTRPGPIRSGRLTGTPTAA